MSDYREFPVKFESPVELLAFYDDDMNNGQIKLHNWQIDRMKVFGRNRKNSADIIKAALCSANGVGKSQFVLAPCACWMAITHVESLTVITTASGEQLDTQDQRYIRRLGEKINSVHREDLGGMDVFKLNYRQFFNNVTGSFIDMFATDEPKKAEGRHPIRPNAEFAIIVDEAKTVSDDIFGALDRCTGFTRKYLISSPGDSSGYFYDIMIMSDSGFDKRTVTAFECSHLNKDDIAWKIRKYGLNHPLIRSSIFAEFVHIGGAVVISRELLKKCQALLTRTIHFGPIRAGFDISAGGDEQVISIWHGNEMLAQICWNITDTIELVYKAIEVFKEWKIDARNIYADDGGLGRAVIDNFREKGWNFNRINNQSRAYDYMHYANRGAELYWNFRRFVEEKQVKIIDDGILFNQLTTRQTRQQQATGKILLESKAEAKKHGRPSPDRADACVLAWVPYIFPVDALQHNADDKNDRTTHCQAITAEELIALFDTELRMNYQAGMNNANNNVVDGRYIKNDNFVSNYKTLMEKLNERSKIFRRYE